VLGHTHNTTIHRGRVLCAVLFYTQPTVLGHLLCLLQLNLLRKIAALRLVPFDSCECIPHTQCFVLTKFTYHQERDKMNHYVSSTNKIYEPLRIIDQ
jgi:hypothetical protein